MLLVLVLLLALLVLLATGAAGQQEGGLAGLGPGQAAAAEDGLEPTILSTASPFVT